jgi:hypothetical protein
MVVIGLLWTWLLPGAALAQGADTYGVGGGKAQFEGVPFLFTFNLSAHDGGPQGDFGHVGGTITDGAGNKLSYWMDAKCVAINGIFVPATASIFGTVKKASGSTTFFDFAPGDSLFVGVQDGGNPKNRPVDFFAFSETGGNLDCDRSGLVGPPNVTQGNIVVKQ